jgi:hypothetical protein
MVDIGWELHTRWDLRLTDYFDGQEGEDLADHTPDVDVEGNGWTEQYGSWAITDNKAKCDGKGMATIDSGIADGSVSLRIKAVS